MSGGEKSGDIGGQRKTTETSTIDEFAPRSGPGLRTKISKFAAVYIYTRVADCEKIDSVKLIQELLEIREKIRFTVPSIHQIRRFRRLLSPHVTRSLSLDTERFTARHNLTILRPQFHPLEWVHSDTTQLPFPNYDTPVQAKPRRDVFINWAVDAATQFILGREITPNAPDEEVMLRLIRDVASQNNGSKARQWEFLRIGAWITRQSTRLKM